MKASRRSPVADDGYGKLQHFARGQMPFFTGYHPEGYYWMHINGVPNGAFATRELARQDEIRRISA